MIVVADTSVILNLCSVGQAHLLPALFHEVWVPDEVRIEFERLSLHQPRFQGLRLPDWALIQPAAPVSAELAALANLHAGETAALALALSGHADAVLMDESAGRRAAKLLGMPVIGVLGGAAASPQIQTVACHQACTATAGGGSRVLAVSRFGARGLEKMRGNIAARAF
jgi:predicted nucleic acid-binding protein